MTQLYGKEMVPKNHPRIIFRGKLDSLQSLVVLNQALLAKRDASENLLHHLTDILDTLREVMRCEVFNEEVSRKTLIGLTYEEIRERSHNPGKYFDVKYMSLAEYTLGIEYALLNQLRCAVREVEVAAVSAFQVGEECVREDILETLNRISSVVHILMCMLQAGEL